MKHSPADIMRFYMVQLGVCTLPIDEEDWPGVVNTTNEASKNMILFSDTPARIDGRYMRTGEKIIHPGVQILIRSDKQPDAWQRASLIYKINNSVRNQLITIDSSTYRLRNLSQRGGIVSLSNEELFRSVDRQEKEQKRNRFMFAINLFMTIDDLTDTVLLPSSQAVTTNNDFWLTQSPQGAVNGTNQVFTVITAPSTIYTLYLDNVQIPRENYTINGTTITFVLGEQPSTGTLKLVSVLI